MSGSKNLGTLYVRLNAESKKFLKDMETAAGAVEKFAKESKKLAGDVAQFAGSLLALGGAAVGLAASVDKVTQRSLEALKQSLLLVAIQVADLLRPAITALAQDFRQLANWIAGLDPELKKNVATWAMYAAEVAVAAKAMQQVFALGDGVAGALKSMFGALSGVGLVPLLNLVIIIGAVVAAVLFLHRAWRKNWGGIQDITRTVVENIGSAFKWLTDNLSAAFDGIVDGFTAMLSALLSAVPTGLLEAIGIDPKGISEAIAGLNADLKTGDFFKNGIEFAKSIAGDAADAALEEARIIFGEVKGALGLDQLQKLMAGGKSGAARGAVKYTDADLEGVGEWLRQMDAEAAQRNRESAAAFKAHSAATKQEVALRVAAVAEVRLAYARATGDMTGVSKGAQRELRKDTGGAWRALSKAQQTIGNFARRVGSMVLDAMGPVGKVFNNIKAGAEAGGVWGAVIAAVLEVVTRMAGFQELMQKLEYGLTRLGEFMGPLLQPLFDLLGDAVAFGTEGLAPLFAALQPLFTALAKFLGRIMGSLGDVNSIISGLAPVIELIATAFGGLLDALGPLLDVIGMPLKIAISGVLLFVRSLNLIAAALGDTAAQAEADRLGAMIDRMWASNATDQTLADAAAAGATWELASGAKAAADSMRDVNEQLTNVPSGYKVALARFGATAGDSYTGALGGMGAGGGSTSIGTVNVYSDATSTSELVEDIRKERARERASRGGNPTGGDF